MSTMQAAQFRRFGGPEVLEVGPVDRPRPGEGEVLVRVEASTVNVHDRLLRDGTMRVISGRRFPMGPGLDFAGTVEQADTADATVSTGAKVWGMVSPGGKHTTGSAAEYVVVPASRVAPVPEGLSMVEAASLVTSGTAAIEAVRDKGGTRAGDRVLVRGGAGGTGITIVQLTHALGARVTALAGGQDLGFVRETGADEAFDYRTTGPRDLGPFDVIVDTTGRDLLAFRRRLDRAGRMVTINFGSPSAMTAITASRVFGSRRIRSFSGYPDRALLDDLAGFVRSGAIRPVVSAVYPLSDIVEAHRAVARNGLRGKVVLTHAAGPASDRVAAV